MQFGMRKRVCFDPLGGTLVAIATALVAVSLAVRARGDDKPSPAPAATSQAQAAKSQPAKTDSAKRKSKNDADKAVPIPIAEIKHSGAVDFQTEVLPVLRRNCVACHNSSKAENHLVLESPQSILKGGESGPAVVPKHSADSLLLQAAAHLDDPTMPPPDNNVKAVALTSQELGLIKLWIDQGATGQVSAGAARHWQKLPATVRPVLAVAVSPDGELAACGRGNEIYVYGIGSGATVARLVDPELAGQAGAGGPGTAHLDLVESLAFQPSGDLLASGGFREVKIWQRPRNVRLGMLSGARGAISVVAVDPDGTRAATGSADGTIQLWEIPSGKQLQTISGHTAVTHNAAITGLAFSADGKTLFSASLDKSVRAWRTADASSVGKIDTPAAVAAMVLAHGGTEICTGESDNTIRIWPVAAITSAAEDSAKTASTTTKDAAKAGATTAAKPLRELHGHSAPITALATWGNGSQIISASRDGTARVWNVEDGRQIRDVNHGAAVIALAARNDGKRFATAGEDNVVRLWNGENGQKIAEVRGDFRKQWEVGRLARLADVARSRLNESRQAVTDAETLAKQESDDIQKAKDRQTAAQKELTDKTAAAKQPLEAKATAEKDLAAAQAAAKSAAEKATIVKSAADKDPKNKDLAKAAADAKQTTDAAERKQTEAKQRVEATARSADGPLAERKRAEDSVAAAATNVKLAEQSAHRAADAVPVAKHAVDAAELAVKQAEAAQQSAAKAAGDAKPVRALAFSPNGLFLAMAGDDHLTQTISADSGAPGDTFETAASTGAAPTGAASTAAAGALLSLAYTPAGGLLAGGADRSAIVWNTEPAWPLVRTIGRADDPTKFIHRVISLDFSPDGALLATGGGYPSRSGELKLWNPNDGSLVREIANAHSDTICSVRFSPDGKLLASGATDRTMRVFNVASGSLMKTFEGHSHHVLGVAWRADGEQLATAGGDNTVKVWDYASGEQRRSIETFGKEVTAIQYVGASTRVLTTCGDHFVRLLNTENGNQEAIFGGATDFLYSLGVTPDGSLVVAGGQDGVVRVWNVGNSQIVRTFER